MGVSSFSVNTSDLEALKCLREAVDTGALHKASYLGTSSDSVASFAMVVSAGTVKSHAAASTASSTMAKQWCPKFHAFACLH